MINISVFVCLKKFNLPSCLKAILLGMESYTDSFFFFLLLFCFPFSPSEGCSAGFLLVSDMKSDVILVFLPLCG